MALKNETMNQRIQLSRVFVMFFGGRTSDCNQNVQTKCCYSNTLLTKKDILELFRIVKTGFIDFLYHEHVRKKF